MKFTNFGKKLFAFIAVLTFGLVLVSCGGGNQTNEKEQHQANVQAVLDGIFFDETQLEGVISDIYLVKNNGKYAEVKIEWTSSETDLIAADGKVTRPYSDDQRIKEGTNYVEVTMTVTASQGEAKGTKSFVFQVLSEERVDKDSAQALKKSFYTKIQTNGLKYDAKTYEGDFPISAELTGEVVIKFENKNGGTCFFINDGTGVIYVYNKTTKYDIAVGDTVKVAGSVYTSYGLVEFSNPTTVEKVADKTFTAPNFVETTISEYTASLDAALDANGKILDVDAFVPFSCGAFKLYAKVEKGDKGSGDTYYLVDPYTAQSVAIYHYTTVEHTATLDALVGKYVYANVYAYDTHSSLADRYRVVWDGSTMVEAAAPDLSDAQKVAIALASCSVATTLTEDLTLPVVDGVVWTLKETYAAATIEAGVLKVTRPENGEGNATVVLVATATFGTATDTKEFELTITELPKEVEAGETLVSYEISGSIPTGLTYITNNEKNPDPSFYSDGGLKMNYVNQGVKTGTFEAQSSVVVVLTVNKLNDNEKTNSGKDAFTVYGLDANGNVVATAGLANVVVGDNAVALIGEGIVSVKIVMTDYTAGSTAGVCANVNLGGVAVAKTE